jgi:hypothetical protein
VIAAAISFVDVTCLHEMATKDQNSGRILAVRSARRDEFRKELGVTFSGLLNITPNES